MNKILFFILLIIGIISCNSKSEKVKIVSSPGKEIFLKGESLGMAELLADPAEMYYWDSLLYLIEDADSCKMVVCDPSKGEIINKLIPKGRGPGEQIGTSFFASAQNSRKIFSFDMTMQRILELERDSTVFPGYKPVMSYAIPAELTVFRGALVKDSIFVVCGNMADCRVAIFTLNGQIDKFGDSPDVKRDVDAIINQAYTGTIKVAPNGDKFAIACWYADQLEIFNFKDDLHQLFVKGPALFEPQYAVEQVGKYKVLAHKKDERLGYTDMYVTDDYLYVLYSGKLFGPENVYSNHIRVFSWAGDYLMDYVLDKEVFSFTLNEDESCIYGLVSEPGAEIYRFRLEK